MIDTQILGHCDGIIDSLAPGTASARVTVDVVLFDARVSYGSLGRLRVMLDSIEVVGDRQV